MTQLPSLLTAADVAPRYDTSTETVLRWARQGKLPCVKLPSGRIKFRRDVIDELAPLGDTSGADVGEIDTNPTK